MLSTEIGFAAKASAHDVALLKSCNTNSPKQNSWMKLISFISDKKTAFNACKKALTDSQIVISYENLEEGVIEAKKSGNFFSYGHIIIIEINKSIIQVTSNTLGIQIIDWGTNKENEEEISREIAKLLR